MSWPYFEPDGDKPDGEDEEEADISDEFEETDESLAPSADVYDHAGDIYFMNGEHAKAVEFWEKAHELDPDDEIIAKKVKHRTIFFR